MVRPLARGGAVHRVRLANIPPAFSSLRNYQTRNIFVEMFTVDRAELRSLNSVLHCRELRLESRSDSIERDHVGQTGKDFSR
jgi:hypothetical protein